MGSIPNFFNILFNQIKKSGVRMTIKHAAPNKITDDNQSISIGAINEKCSDHLRSKGPIRTTG